MYITLYLLNLAPDWLDRMISPRPSLRRLPMVMEGDDWFSSFGGGLAKVVLSFSGGCFLGRVCALAMTSDSIIQPTFRTPIYWG